MAKLQKKTPPDNIELSEIGDAKHPHPAQRCPSSKGCDKANCRKPWHQPYSKTNVVTKLRPVLVFTGCTEAVLGSVLLVVVVIFSADFDRLYGVEKSKTMSLLCFGGLVAMSVSGTLLLISVQLNKRSIMWLYVVASSFICVYIFGVALVMMQYGLYNVPTLQMKFDFLNSSTCTPASNLSTTTMKPLHLLNTVEPVPILKMKLEILNSSTSSSAASNLSSSTTKLHLLNTVEPAPILPMKLEFSNSSTSTPAASNLSISMMKPDLLNTVKPVQILKIGFSNSSTSTPAANLSLSTTKLPHLLNTVQPVPCSMYGNSFLFGKAFVISLLTLLGSVAYFVGTVTAFTFYNLKYVHPLLLYCNTQDL